MLVYALQEAGGAFAWGSGPIIGTLVGSGVALLMFVLHEIWVQRRTKIEPIFPVSLLDSETLLLNLM